jgi:hypothetical protein
MPTLLKPLRELKSDDLDRVVSESWKEDERLEFKEALAASKSQQGKNPWYEGADEISHTAKGDLFAEVVAMANSFGGDVILGIRESKGEDAEGRKEPRRAIGRLLVPRCRELADRLRASARDSIEPELPILQVEPVEVSGGEGYVVFRVPRSHLAPHRVNLKGMEKECYQRVGESTVPMSMRAIQDLTLATVRRSERTEARLAQLREGFREWSKVDEFTPEERGFALAVFAVPVGVELYVDRLYGHAEVLPRVKDYLATIGASAVTLKSFHFATNWRPILRGARATDVIGGQRSVTEVWRDGVYRSATKVLVPKPETKPDADSSDSRRSLLHPGRVFGAICNALAAVHRLRQQAQAEAILYALEMQILTSPTMAPLPVPGYPHGAGVEDATLHDRRLTLPLYEVGAPNSWDELLGGAWVDFWNALGVEPVRRDFRVSW